MISKKFCHANCKYYAEDFGNIYCLLQNNFAEPDKCKYSKWGEQYTLEDLLTKQKKKLHIRPFSPLWVFIRICFGIGIGIGTYGWILLIYAFFG